MITLFDLNENNKVTIKPEVLQIPEFKAIWDADKSKTKDVALNELTYVYFVADFNSPYSNYPEDTKEDSISEDIFKKKQIPRKEIRNAIEKYKTLTETHTMRLLRAAKEATDKLAEYFRGVDYTATDEQGKLLYNAKDVAANLANMGKIVESLDAVEEKIKKEQTSRTKIRGGGDVGNYER